MMGAHRHPWRRLLVQVLAVLLAHELLLAILARTDLVSAVFSLGGHTPVVACVVAAAFVGLRLGVFFVLPAFVIFKVGRGLASTSPRSGD